MNTTSESVNYISGLPEMLGALSVVVLWMLGVFVALAIFSIFFKSFHRIVYRLMQAGLVVLLLCGTLLGAYLFFFDRCGALANYDDGSHARLIGVCREVRISPLGDGRRASFLLRDPTGSLRVVTTSGAPAEGSVVYLRGRKGTFDGNSTFVESDYQLSPF